MNGKLVTKNLLEFVSDDTLVGSNGKTLDKVINEVGNECENVTDADR